MFKKAIIALSIAAVSAASAVAQVQPVDDYKKGEVYVGYSNGQVDTGISSGDSIRDFFRDRENFNGVNVSGVYNFSRYVGAKFDVAGHYRSDDIFVGPFADRVDSSLYNFLGGVQIKDNSTSNGRLRPFGHLLVGAAMAKTEFESLEQLGFDDDFNETGLAGAIGGGLDINASERIDIRVFQIDYNPTRLFDSWQHNFRIGIGIVFH